ncbi:MAG TPA: stage II sporulation protein D [Tenericutes bacterium]|nr:stage II sporulation protein D [Mycoplasmatota bacterium]
MKKGILIILLIFIVPYIIVNVIMKKPIEKIYDLKTDITIRVKRTKKNIIEVIPLEEYVVGVLAGEMPISFHVEALKAQAIAARTYALKRIEYNKKNTYDVVDTVDHQVYLDLDYLKVAWKDKYIENINKLRKAVFETKDEVLVYNGKIIDALYFSTSNGYTENSENVFSFEVPYLRSVESNWDRTTSPAFNSTKQITLDEFYNKLGLPYSENFDFKVLSRAETNRILTLSVNGKVFNARELYVKLGLRSTDFEIEKKGNILTFFTKGYGHGVGMSQYGANGMAKEGYNYKEILLHYYYGVEIKKIK